jgi:Class III cytochrome C family
MMMLFAVPAQGQEAITDTLRTAIDCLQCHADGSDFNLLKYKIDLIKLQNPEEFIDYQFDPAVYYGSNHGKLECRVCHIVGKEVYPHLKEAKSQYLTCTYCHRRDRTDQRFAVKKIEDDFNKSIHVAKAGDKFTCFKCHNPHEFNITDRDKPIREIITDDNRICRGCHSHEPIFETLTEREFPNIMDTHGWLPSAELHWRAIRCVECHTAHTETFTHKILAQDKSEQRCVSCHRRDTILLTTLFKHQAETEISRLGFANAAIFGEVYMIGVTRNIYLDRLALIIFGATLLALIGHGGLRWLSSRQRAAAAGKEKS